MVRNPPVMQETWVRSLGWEDLLENGMATHSSILAWRIPWTEEPGRLQSMGSQRVEWDWATNTFTFWNKRAFCQLVAFRCELQCGSSLVLQPAYPEGFRIPSPLNYMGQSPNTHLSPREAHPLGSVFLESLGAPAVWLCLFASLLCPLRAPMSPYFPSVGACLRAASHR